MFKGEDNNKEVPVQGGNDSGSNFISFEDAMNIDVFGGASAFGNQALGNYSGIVDSKKIFGSNKTNNSGSISQTFISERII